ncbi:family 43 glycosylhydrolase [Yinghuangia sp. YIM S10712]|uniref:family 43 glycosylhydrolase n=1 Tax=Yinghuangia sp. YIM S10712 TaxID=3436930 RepID=UPI003F52922D
MGNPPQESIRPGTRWLDTKGERIQAHGGSILHVDGTFYWYGENKEKTVPGSGIWHWGIRCYASKDLYNWEDRGLIIPPEPDDLASPLHPSKQVDRPHIIHDKRTGRFVCWLKIMGDIQESTVLVAEAIEGPYRIVRTGLRPLGMSAGDFDLVVDPHDGKGYYYFERVHSELICADLTADYTDVTGYYSTHFPQPHPPFVREAPAYFRRGAKHYLVTSGTSGYVPNSSQVAVADSYHGPWTVLGDPHPGDTTGTSYRSQISSVFRHPHKKDLYIALADRWLPNLSAEICGRVVKGMADAMTSGGGLPTADEQREVPDGLSDLLDANTSIADYVWLPIRFDGDMPVLDWHDEWHVEDFN